MIDRTNRSAYAFAFGARERCLHHAKASLVQQPSHLRTPFPIPIADQHAVVTQQPILNGRHRATDLAHEQIPRMRRGPDNLDAA